MAKLVPTHQWLVTGVMYPRGVYSRIISCMALVMGGGGAEVAYTQSVGQKCWLLGIDIWTVMDPDTANANFEVTARRGHAVPGSLAIAQAWHNLLPVFRAGTMNLWASLEPNKHWHWDLNLYCEAVPVRFAIDARNAGVDILIAYASFQISEA